MKKLTKYFFVAGDSIVLPEALEVRFFKDNKQVYPKLKATVPWELIELLGGDNEEDKE